MWAAADMAEGEHEAAARVKLAAVGFQFLRHLVEPAHQAGQFVDRVPEMVAGTLDFLLKFLGEESALRLDLTDEPEPNEPTLTTMAVFDALAGR